MRRICIAGFSSLSRNWANELPEDVEVWAMNEAYLFLERPATRYFQIHPRNWNEAKSLEKGLPADVYGRMPDHIDQLNKTGVPVYMKEVDERIPLSVKYPMEEITERYGMEIIPGLKRPYLTSTASYMLALAIMEHDDGNCVDEIDLAGIELAVGTEYFHQRACFEYWCGFAAGRGIKVNRPPTGSSILVGPVYAVDHASPLYPQSMEAVEFSFDPDKAPLAAVLEDREGRPIGL